jgi:hypothetical protein
MGDRQIAQQLSRPARSDALSWRESPVLNMSLPLLFPQLRDFRLLPCREIETGGTRSSVMACSQLSYSGGARTRVHFLARRTACLQNLQTREAWRTLLLAVPTASPPDSARVARTITHGAGDCLPAERPAIPQATFPCQKGIPAPRRSLLSAVLQAVLRFPRLPQ